MTWSNFVVPVSVGANIVPSSRIITAGFYGLLRGEVKRGEKGRKEETV